VSKHNPIKIPGDDDKTTDNGSQGSLHTDSKTVPLEQPLLKKIDS